MGGVGGVGSVGPQNFGVGSVGRDFSLGGMVGVGQKSSMGECHAI